MEDLNQTSLLKLIDMEHEGMKYMCKVKIVEDDLININNYLFR